MTSFRRTAPLILLPLALTSLGGLAGCSDEEDTDTLRLTLEEGVVLGYDVAEIWHFHDPVDSTVSLGGDSLQAWLSVTVAEQGYLYDQLARRVRERTDWHEWGRPLEDAGTELADLFYQEDGESLLLLAWVGGSNLALGVDPAAARPRRLDKPGQPGVDDELVVEDPPLLVLRYPLEVGSDWTYRQAGYPHRIDKVVAARGVEDPDGLGLRECVTLDWRYDLDRDGGWDEDVRMRTVCDDHGVVTQTLELDDQSVTHPVSGLVVAADYRLTLVRASDSTLED